MSAATFRAPRVLAMETRAEFLKLLRLPAFVVPTLAMPVMFYVLFGLAFGGGRTVASARVTTYMIATYGVFGVVGAALGGLGIGIAMERGQGWLLVKRASPMPPWAYFAAKVAMSMLFAAVIAIVLFAVAYAFGHVRLPFASWLALGGTLVIGADQSSPAVHLGALAAFSAAFLAIAVFAFRRDQGRTYG